MSTMEAPQSIQSTPDARPRSAAPILTPDEANSLFALCRAGKLYEIDALIAAGQSILTPPEIKKSPLQVSISTGFHSLVELLARHTHDQSLLNAALRDAVESRRLDLVELIVDHGADIRSYPFSEVLLDWEPRLIRYFLDKGADIITGSPFAVAFANRVRTALRLFKECIEAHPELAARLREQAGQALRYHANKGDEKWVSLMLWVGADPRSCGPAALDDFRDDEECFTTALRAAAYCDTPAVLKKFKPDPARDNLAELLSTAAMFARKDTLTYLLSLGVQPNDKPNGGSSALDQCMCHLDRFHWDAWRFKKLIPRYKASETVGCIELLATAGALWRPDDKRPMSDLRRSACTCQPEVHPEVLQVLLKHGACSEQAVRELLSPPRMQQHVSSAEWHLCRIGIKGLVTAMRDGTLGKVVGGARPGGIGAARGKPAPRRPTYISYHTLAKYNREKLYEEVWAEPMLKVAARYGVSDVALAKTCRKFRVPVPGRGYWAKKAAGKKVRARPPLPAME